MGIFNFLNPDKTISFSSKYNTLIELIATAHKKKIIVDGAEQTGGTITGMWEKAMSLVISHRSFVDNCLVLGLGGGDVIRSILKRYPKVAITCIEIDLVMIEIAKKYFQLPQTLKIIHADAFEWMNRKLSQKYDLVVVDLYIGKLNPKQTEEVAFLNQLKKLLTNDGVIIYNRHYFSTKHRDYQSFVNRCHAVFENVTEIVKYKYCRILQLDADYGTIIVSCSNF